MNSKDMRMLTSTSLLKPHPESRLEVGQSANPQQTTLLSISLLSLPRKVRENIYKRVLVVAHSVFTFQEKGSEIVESFAPERPFRWLTLMYTNRQIYAEAAIVLYGLNHFTFIDTTQHQGDLLQSFFNCVGSTNSGHMSYLPINFPVVESAEDRLGDVVLKQDDLLSLKLLKEKCTKLTTLETLLYGRDSGSLINPIEGDAQFVREALSQIDLQFKAIPLLSNIIVRYYEGTPAPWVVDLIQGFGWVVRRGR